MAAAKKSAREMLALFLNAKTLFRNRTMARVTTIIWITFIADFWGFTLAGFYLPQILRAKGVEEDTSIETIYRNYILIYFPGIFAVAFGAAMIEVPRFGRQWAMVVSSALMAISFFLFSRVSDTAGSIGLNAMEYFFQSFFNSILYAFVPEIYPSQVRGTASGLASTLGRIASIVAPLAADPLYRDKTEEQARHVLYLAGSITLLCPIALAFLPYDTRGMRVVILVAAAACEPKGVDWKRPGLAGRAWQHEESIVGEVILATSGDSCMHVREHANEVVRSTVSQACQSMLQACTSRFGGIFNSQGLSAGKPRRAACRCCPTEHLSGACFPLPFHPLPP
ncbi:hypothetical protein L1887_59541 [Cichorium endivia]|nr:hypothetical protein L1887_59541 [Cichorium endivia]